LLLLSFRRAGLSAQAVERVVPDARKMAKTVLIGSPLTHERFNRRRSVGERSMPTPRPHAYRPPAEAFAGLSVPLPV